MSFITDIINFSPWYVVSARGKMTGCGSISRFQTYGLQTYAKWFSCKVSKLWMNCHVCTLTSFCLHWTFCRISQQPYLAANYQKTCLEALIRVLHAPKGASYDEIQHCRVFNMHSLYAVVLLLLYCWYNHAHNTKSIFTVLLSISWSWEIADVILYCCQGS